MIALIIRALYGLTTSAEHFHTLLVHFLRSIRFKLSHFDRDILEAVVVFHDCTPIKTYFTLSVFLLLVHSKRDSLIKSISLIKDHY